MEQKRGKSSGGETSKLFQSKNFFTSFYTREFVFELLLFSGKIKINMKLIGALTIIFARLCHSFCK